MYAFVPLCVCDFPSKNESQYYFLSCACPYATLFRDISDSKSNGRTSASPFVMRVFEDEMDNIDSEDEEALDQSSVAVKRFNFDDLYLRYAIKFPTFVSSYKSLF